LFRPALQAVLQMVKDLRSLSACCFQQRPWIDILHWPCQNHEPAEIR